ncbi:MAG TPA: hypothetical protein VLI90_20695, partial [Tepidisphaeraceae bacterium]|nr:hypothetical protein [Tepidisphaeraceae bacterium]
MISSPLRAATPQQVDEMLTKAKAYLYNKQRNGNWEVADKAEADDQFYSPGSGQWGGTTALTVYALLAAGESPQDPRLAPAIAFLKKAEIRGVYALSLRCQVWPLLPQSQEIHKLA